MTLAITIRLLGPDEDTWRRDRLEAVWGSTVVARLGEAVDAAGLPGLVAEVDGDRCGLLTFRAAGGDVEVVTIQADRPRLGVGTALLEAAVAEAERLGARRLWLITTNDNVGALAFHQRCGLDLVALHRHGVERSRRVKPSIPATGAGGVPIRHELELELRLSGL